MGVALDEWIGRLRDEYLEGFISGGGSAVRLAMAPSVAPGGPADDALYRLQREAAEKGYLVARVDGAQTRLHMIDQIFFAVARQIDWDGLTEAWLRDLLERNGIHVEPGCPLRDLDAIAEANGRLRPDLLSEINRLINHSILTDYTLSREFRTAVAMLGRSRINPQNVPPTDADVIKRWLVGERSSLAALKQLQLYSRIGRHNARLLLASLAVWLHDAGFAGLALLLDLRPLQADRAPAADPNAAPAVRYTRNSVLDVYEVLRQFIDDTDETAYLLVAGVAGPGLLDDPKRGVDNYSALKLRIVDDVHDQRQSNPLNVLVRLESEN